MKRLLSLIMTSIFILLLAGCWTEKITIHKVDYTSFLNSNHVSTVKNMGVNIWYINKGKEYQNIKKYLFWGKDKNWIPYKKYTCIIVNINAPVITVCNKNGKIVEVDKTYSVSDSFSDIFNSVLARYIQKDILKKKIKWEHFNMFMGFNNIKLNKLKGYNLATTEIPFTAYSVRSNQAKDLLNVFNKRVGYIAGYGEINHLKEYFFWWKIKWKKVKPYNCVMFWYSSADELYCNQNWKIVSVAHNWLWKKRSLSEYYNKLFAESTKNLVK